MLKTNIISSKYWVSNLFVSLEQSNTIIYTRTEKRIRIGHFFVNVSSARISWILSVQWIQTRKIDRIYLLLENMRINCKIRNIGGNLWTQWIQRIWTRFFPNEQTKEVERRVSKIVLWSLKSIYQILAQIHMAQFHLATVLYYHASLMHAWFHIRIRFHGIY